MARAVIIWLVLALAMALPVVHAAFSPLLQWRDAVYITAGFAGIIALSAMVLQPLLAIDALPGFTAFTGRRVHRWVGAGLVAAVVVHVGGLWLVSPPDVVDVLLFRSPTPFAVWGALAMWAVFASAALALVRKRLGLRLWRIVHVCLVGLIVPGTVVHAWLIEGAMHPASKAAICAVVLVTAAGAVWHRFIRTR